MEASFTKEEDVTFELEMDKCEDKIFQEDSVISFNNNNNRCTGQKVKEVSAYESVLQTELEGKDDDAFEAMQEETVEFEEILEEIEILELQDEEDTGIVSQSNIKVKEGKDDLLVKFEEIKNNKDNEEEEEKMYNGLDKFVKGEMQHQVTLKVGQETNKEIENKALQAMKCLYEKSDGIEGTYEDVYKEILINEEDMTNLEEYDNNNDIEEEERDETEEEIEKLIEKEEADEEIEEDKEICMEENEDTYENKNSIVGQEKKEKKKFKNVKILDEFITQEREISMMTNVINETLKKVVEENNHKKAVKKNRGKLFPDTDKD